jgi:hypothetical protein
MLQLLAVNTTTARSDTSLATRSIDSTLECSRDLAHRRVCTRWFEKVGWCGFLVLAMVSFYRMEKILAVSSGACSVGWWLMAGAGLF